MGFLLWVICGFAVVKVGGCRGDGGGHGFRDWDFYSCGGVMTWPWVSVWVYSLW